MVADGMQGMNNIKCGIDSFYVRHNLTVGTAAADMTTADSVTA
jgi:hypothetical protein